jgi:outer membrane lipoprotein-sorting protein
MTRPMRRLFSTGILLATLLCGALVLCAQEQGPMAPPPKFEVKRIPSVPHPGPPPIPVEEIIQRFAANEDVMMAAYSTYHFTQTIRVEELSDPGGKFTATGEVYTKPDGSRYWRVTTPPQSNLKVMHFSLEDVRTMVSIPPFVLTSDEIANYNFLYAGQDKLDELNTYVFQVKPKLLSRKRRFFEGVIWVDDHDLAIVKTYGKFVSDISGSGPQLPFTMFETYRENFQAKYWLPTYTSSDDYVDTDGNAQLHLRLVIHSTNFQLNAPPSAAPAAETAPQAAAPPAPPRAPSPSAPAPRN